MTVAWTVPNSQYAWLPRAKSGDFLIDTTETGVGIYFVYTSTRLDNVSTIAPTKAGTQPTLSGVTVADKAVFANEANEKDGTIGARASFSSLSFSSLSEGEVDSGYFYMVVFSKASNENLYMVAGGRQYVADPDANTGIYESTVSGTKPSGADYVDNIAIIGGTWTAAKTPEPTTVALLALGIAGLALRRKVS